AGRGRTPGQLGAGSQGWKRNGPIKDRERKPAGGEIVDAPQPRMAWCVGNAKAESKGNATAITKQVSGSAKIDPLMAGFNAVTLMSRNPASRKRKFQMFVLGGRNGG